MGYVNFKIGPDGVDPTITWWAGVIERAAASPKFRNTRMGAYLVRGKPQQIQFEADSTCGHTLDVASTLNGRLEVRHIPIQLEKETKLYFLSKRKLFQSVPALVAYYQKNSLEGHFPDIMTTLTLPVGGMVWPEFIDSVNSVLSGSGRQTISNQSLPDYVNLASQSSQLDYNIAEKLEAKKAKAYVGGIGTTQIIPRGSVSAVQLPEYVNLGPSSSNGEEAAPAEASRSHVRTQSSKNRTGSLQMQMPEYVNLGPNEDASGQGQTQVRRKSGRGSVVVPKVEDRAEFTHDFDGEVENGEVTAKKGTMVHILSKYDDGWTKVRLPSGAEGVCPQSYLREHAPPLPQRM